MSTQDNKALAQCWLDEVWNKGDLGLIDEMIANFGGHTPHSSWFGSGMGLFEIDTTER